MLWRKKREPVLPPMPKIDDFLHDGHYYRDEYSLALDAWKVVCIEVTKAWQKQCCAYCCDECE